MRRTRQHDFSRALVQETKLHSDDLILPLFVCEGKNIKETITTLPGVYRYSIDNILQVAALAHSLNIRALALFPIIDSNKKSAMAEEALNPNGLIQSSIKAIKDKLPDMGIITDVALDPYTLSGHDGIVDTNNYCLNDETVAILAQQALSHAQAGADIVAPSDMMDGRVAQIRQTLEDASYSNTLILAYAAKYASCMYGPFRDALATTGQLGSSNKGQYQMDFANQNEAIHEVLLDLQEGADIVMVKPGLPYLDVIYRINQECKIPVFAYQVSGEYAMLQFAAQNGCFALEDAMLESLVCLKRAGARAIFSYFALDAAKILLK